MSDAPASAPSAPAPSAPTAAPTQGALSLGGTPPPATQHHSAGQPRTPEGKFNGPPDPAKATPAASAPEAPRTFRVGDREFKSAEELALYASEADAERRALDVFRKQAAEAAAKARELEERVKDPRKAITPEMRQALIREEIERFQEEERIKALSPEQRQLYLYAREQERRASEIEAKLKAREEADAEAKRKADEEAQQRAEVAAREEMKATLTQAVQMAGLDPTNPWDFQRVAFVVRGAAERGVVYSPEVIAAKVKQGIAAEQRLRLKAAQPSQLLNDVPELVATLNGIEDASLLRLLAPLGEKLRRLNLQSLGATPPPAQTPVATGAAATTMEKPPPGDPAWDAYFRRRAKGQ